MCVGSQGCQKSESYHTPYFLRGIFHHNQENAYTNGLIEEWHCILA